MIILDSHIEGAQCYGPKQRGELYRAIVEYCYFGIEPDFLKGETLGFFIAIKPTLDKNVARSEAGKASGRARRANAKQTDEQTANKRGTKAEQKPSETRANAKQTDEQTAKEDEDEDEGFVSSETNHPIAPAVYVEIVAYLNERTGRDYKHTSEATRKLIRARLAEGYTVDDFKRVIDNKAASWLDDPKMEAYLRPSTLFSKSKFEGYLNERPVAKKGGGRFDRYAD